MDMPTSQYNLAYESSDQDLTSSSIDTLTIQQDLARAHGFDPSKTRILAFNAAPPTQERTAEDLKRLYNSASKPAMQPLQRRRILTTPERVLDAPGLMDDYYLNLLDWSTDNQVAIGLGAGVYLWGADTGDVIPLCELPNADQDYVSSVKFSQDAAFVAVGTCDGNIHVYDIEARQKIRTMKHSPGIRVSSLAWNEHILASGAKDGSIWLHDVRVAEHKIAELVNHTAEICGLAWRSDGKQLASGGNDNVVNIWEPADRTGKITPLFQQTRHTAAVKALAWCPWQLNLLATGGGTQDKHIHFWNTGTGALLHSIDAQSQVTALIWSPMHHRELLSAHGFPGYQLTLWSYPGLQRIIEIPAHETRVLHACVCPIDNEIVATAASDENLKFWKIWEPKRQDKKEKIPTQPTMTTGSKAKPMISSRTTTTSRPRSLIR